MSETSYLYTLYDIFIASKNYLYMVQGLWFSFLCTLIASCVGILLGVLFALMQLSQFYPFKKSHKYANFNPLQKLSTIYVDLIRGTPAVVQLMIMANIIFVGRLRNVPIIVIAALSFGINSGAYVAEIIRAGIQGLDKGQMEAARALGMPYKLAMQDIIIPQAIKKILPTLVSEFITLLKETSIVGFIGGVDLLRSANIITSLTYRGVEPLLAVGLIYLVLTIIFTKIMRRVEKKMRESD